MSNVGKAIAGVAASAGVLLGAYGLSEFEASQERAAVRECVELFEGEARTECLDEAASEQLIPSVLGIAGAVGIVGCGYLGYKTLKEELGTTGLIDDHL